MIRLAAQSDLTNSPNLWAAPEATPAAKRTARGAARLIGDTMKTLSFDSYAELCRRHPATFPDDSPGPMTSGGMMPQDKIVLSEREDLAGGMGGFLPIPHCSLCGQNHWRKCMS